MHFFNVKGCIFSNFRTAQGKSDLHMVLVTRRHHAKKAFLASLIVSALTSGFVKNFSLICNHFIGCKPYQNCHNIFPLSLPFFLYSFPSPLPTTLLLFLLLLLLLPNYQNLNLATKFQASIERLILYSMNQNLKKKLDEAT